jgi:hypothetical protein
MNSVSERVIANASTVSGWRKSSFSGGSSGECVEVVDGYAAGVPVRDSANPSGPAIVVSRRAWSALISSVKATDLS